MEVERATPSGGGLEALAPVHRQGAINLCHYLALRLHDVRSLQVTLTELGLSSLGRAEGHVHATLLMVRRALGLLTGVPESSRPPLGPDFQCSRESLAAQADALLGPAPEGRAVRIMVTADGVWRTRPSPFLLLLKRGMSCLRVNCAHDGIDVWSRIAKNLRAAERQLGLSCRLLMDLGGPKIRTGPLEPGPAVVTWKVQRDARGRVLTLPRYGWFPRARARFVQRQC